MLEAAFSIHRVIEILPTIFHSSLFLDFIYLPFFRERGRAGEKERDKHQRATDTKIGSLSLIPKWGPSPQPSHVP